MQLLSGGQYALAVWTDSSFSTYYSLTSTSGYMAIPAEDYSNYAMPGVISVTGVPDSGMQTVAMAATGCLDSASIVAPGTALYYMCAYTEQYTPAPSNTDYTQTSITTVLSISGVVTVSTTQPSNVVGAGYSVLSFSGTLSTQVSGQVGQNYPQSSANVLNLVLTNATSKVAGLTPSNLVYTTGAATAVDQNGLSFTASGGVQYVLQWNAAARQYQLLTSISSGATPAVPVVASSVTLSPITAANDPLFDCTPAQFYIPPTVPSCPSGYTSSYAGDLQGQQPYDYVSSLNGAGASGNVLYFRPFVVQVSGSLVTSLSTYLLPNPAAVLHMRLGLYALNGTLTWPSWTLVVMAAEQVLVNYAGGVVEVPLPAPVLVQPGTYAISVWYDQPVYAYINYWSNPTNPSNQQQSYTSLSPTGQLPSTVVPLFTLGGLGVAAAQICIPTTQLVQFSFCSIAYDGSDIFVGVLTALATPLTNSFGSYYVVLAGNGTDGYFSAVIGAFNTPAPQRLYIPDTTAGNVSLDSTGLQYIYTESEQIWTYIVLAQPIASTPAYQYLALQGSTYGSVSFGTLPAQFSYQPYSAGDPLPDCTYTFSSYPNTLTPPSQPPLMCSGMTALNVTLGDTVLADYSNQTQGQSVPGLTVYTNPFTVAISGLVISQVAVDVLDNTAQNVSAYMGVYSSTGALLATSPLLYWQQVYSQQVVANLTSSVPLAAGSYYAAIITDVSLSIATSTSLSPSFVVSSLTAGLPASISLTASTAGSVPLFVTGCAPATHSVCAQVQYYMPAALGGPLSTTYQYQGLLAAAANADGSATVQAASVHTTALQHTVSSFVSSVVAYTVLNLAATSTVYPSSAVGLDGRGLLLSSSSTPGLSVTLSYSAVLGQYVDTLGASAYTGSIVAASSFSLVFIASSGVAVPSCSVTSLPGSITSSPAPPTCAAGSSSVTVGDYVSAHYAYDTEETFVVRNQYASFVTVPVVTGNSSVLLSQLALGVLNNPNTVGKLRLAVYDSNLVLLGSSNELTLTNPTDAVVVGVLASPVLLAASTKYYLAVWMETILFTAFDGNGANWCLALPYVSSQPFFSYITSNSVVLNAYCYTIPLAGLGCTVPASSSSSAAPTSFTSSLSSAAISPITAATSAPSTATQSSTALSSSSATAASLTALPTCSPAPVTPPSPIPSSSSPAASSTAAASFVSSSSPSGPASWSTASTATPATSPGVPSTAGPSSFFTSSSYSSSISASSAISVVPSSTCSCNGGSNDVSLSAGAVAGIVVGCVVGTNLLLLLCLLLIFGAPTGRKPVDGSTTHKSKQAGEQEPNSRIELAIAERSTLSKQSEI